MNEPNDWKSIVLIYYFIQAAAIIACAVFIVGIGILAVQYIAPDSFINYVLSNF
ncbi:hypothetical protein LZD49_26240 [Dyadobacter sp. CY261]|uniref:hypothetical protein n=1 Tax=Dyadobacter sp. CY261 TaxID=2907203 RepID=UPI001F348F71|nr:hypothetical protein [Dyadobacter sp. CY261]MCF0074009.1 hypothetical protein [Dyadobacter sp. CY261]